MDNKDIVYEWTTRILYMNGQQGYCTYMNGQNFESFTDIKKDGGKLSVIS